MTETFAQLSHKNFLPVNERKETLKPFKLLILNRASLSTLCFSSQQHFLLSLLTAVKYQSSFTTADFLFTTMMKTFANSYLTATEICDAAKMNTQHL